VAGTGTVGATGERQLRDIVILFGAGASYGAGGVLPEQPPLGDQLLPHLQRSCPGTWGALPVDIVQEFETNKFESGMRLIYERFGHAIPQLMRDMAIYFIQFRPYQGRSLYCKLVRDLSAIDKLSRILFSTLNYECILEQSVAGFGMEIDYFHNDNTEAYVPIWKLHGSSNFFAAMVQASQGVRYSTGVTFEGGLKALPDSNSVIAHCLTETGLAPAMSLYMAGKPVSISPSEIRHVQSMWREAVLGCTAVIIVGVHPVLHDDHIWAPLAQTQAPLYFVGDQSAFASWSRSARTGPFRFLGSRFDTAYATLLEQVKSL